MPRTYLLELASGLSSFLWGLWLLSPWINTFEKYPGSYTLMSRYAPEEVWGGGFLLAGLVLLIGTLWQRRSLRVAGAFCVLWGRLFLLVLIGRFTNWSTNGVPDFFVWSLMAGACLWGALAREP